MATPYAGLNSPVAVTHYVMTGASGVTSTGAKLAGTVDNGLFGAYGNLGWHRLQGKHVADNDQQEFGAGVYVHALDTDYQSLTAGLNVSAMRVAHSGKKKPHPTPSPMASTTRGSSPNLNFIGE
mgnify:CR=1 FL=1